MTPRGKKKQVSYSDLQLNDALSAVSNGMSVGKAARQFQIPRTTLRYKLSGKIPRGISEHGGRQCFLGKEIESEIVEWILQCARRGFPVGRDGLLTTVQQIIEGLPNKGGFKNKRPSVKWFYKFMKRHPEISVKKAEYVNRARGSVTEDKIRLWFKDVKKQLEDYDKILNYPERVFNMDETAFTLAPKGEFILGPVGRHVYMESSHSDKESITTLFAVNAAGVFAPPLTLFKYDRLPLIAAKSAPPNWGIGKSESGWMTGATFYEYIGNVFLPFLNEKNIKRPVIVFLDGHSSHLTLHLSKLCREKGIVLVALYPNATHILQPLDVAVFKPIKAKWGKLKTEWRMMHNGAEISKFDIPKILNQIILEERMVNNIISGFRATGLYPFNPDSVDYGKVIERVENRKQLQVEEDSQSPVKTCVKILESKISPDLLIQFKVIKENGDDFPGDDATKVLYSAWKEMADMQDHNQQDTQPEISSNADDYTKQTDEVKWPERQMKKRRHDQENIPRKSIPELGKGGGGERGYTKIDDTETGTSDAESEDLERLL
uniref:Uncharacterized protein n=1 Tax=Phlebotomus papatasi TaxID=29031 RepID=A0A1B0DJ12_PHLPP